MKVLVVNYYGITPNMPGATKHYDMSMFLKKKDCEVEFWINGINYHTDRPVDESKGARKTYEVNLSNGLKIVYFKGIKQKSSRVRRELGSVFFSLLTSIRLLRTKADVVILSMPPVTNFLAWSAKIRGIKLVADVEDLWPLFLEEAGISNKVILKYYEMQAKSVYKHATGIEAVSNGMLEYVKGQVNCSNKMTWLAPLGVNIEEYDRTTREASFTNYRWCNDYIMMYIGAIGFANDLISVIKTFNRMKEKIQEKNGKNISLVIIGDGGEKRNVEEFVRNNNPWNSVYVEESIKGSLVPEYLKRADICVTNLRRLECYKLVRPNKIFQYMGAGKPIISGIWGEASEIIEEAHAGISVDFSNTDTATMAISEFVLRDDLSAIGLSGNNYIRKYGARSIIFEDFYQRLLRLAGD